MARTTTGAPMRTSGSCGAATLISAQTERRSETVNEAVLSVTDSPTVRCFSTTMPASGARSS